VSGALALLLGEFPQLSADQQGAALDSGAIDLGPAGVDNDYGYGRLDALAAYQWLAATPDFTLSVSPSSASTAAGGTVSYSISVSPEHVFTSDVSLTLGGLTDSQASWSISPPVIAGGSGSAQLTVSTAASIAAGTYPLTITGTAGGATHSVAMTLVVTAPDFALSVRPSSVTIFRGQAAKYTIVVSVAGGSAGDVALTVARLPARTRAVFSPNPVGSPGSSTLKVKTRRLTRRGTYTLRITGTSGSLVHRAKVTLIVR